MIEKAIIAGIRRGGDVRWIADRNASGSWAHIWRLSTTQLGAYFFYVSERDKALRAATKSGCVTARFKHGWTPALWAIDYVREQNAQGFTVYEIVGCRMIFPLTALEQLAKCAP